MMIKNFTMTSLYEFHIVYYCLENKSQPKKFQKIWSVQYVKNKDYW